MRKVKQEKKRPSSWVQKIVKAHYELQQSKPKKDRVYDGVKYTGSIIDRDLHFRVFVDTTMSDCLKTEDLIMNLAIAVTKDAEHTIKAQEVLDFLCGEDEV